MSDPREPQLPRSVRIFARLRRSGFDVECPKCGALSLVRPRIRAPDRASGTASFDTRNFDELTGMWKCRKCERRYQIGLIFYPRTPTRPAPDTVPTVRQARELRALEARRAAEVREKIHVVATERLKRWTAEQRRAEQVNVAPPCICQVDGEGQVPKVWRDARCPRHGWDSEAGEGPEEE